MPIYFASDFHLGADARLSSRQRELELVAWLDWCVGPGGAEAIYLVGDLFEFWFEWRHAVPRGYVRFLGKLAELTDAGLAVHVFTGNHDMWMQDYLTAEVGCTLHREPIYRSLYGKQLLVGHGDGLGPGDYGYKRLKRLFRAPWAQWLYARLHPNLSMATANYFSSRSRSLQPAETEFLGPDREWLIAYAERKLTQRPSIDYFIFGHRHLPIDWLLSNGRARYLNLGEWLHYQTFARLNPDGSLVLLRWKKGEREPSCYPTSLNSDVH